MSSYPRLTDLTTTDIWTVITGTETESTASGTTSLTEILPLGSDSADPLTRLADQFNQLTLAKKPHHRQFGFVDKSQTPSTESSLPPSTAASHPSSPQSQPHSTPTNFWNHFPAPYTTPGTSLTPTLSTSPDSSDNSDMTQQSQFFWGDGRANGRLPEVHHKHIQRDVISHL